MEGEKVFGHFSATLYINIMKVKIWLNFQPNWLKSRNLVNSIQKWFGF